MTKFINFVIKNNKYVLIVILAIAVPLVYSSFKLDFNNSIEIYFNEDDPDVAYYNEFRETYGNEEFALIIFKHDNIFSNEIIDLIRKISDTAKRTNGVQKVFSITEQDEAVVINDTSTFRKIIPDGRLSQQTLKTIKNRVLSNKALLKRFISKGGETTAILIELKPIKNSKKKIDIVHNIRNSVNKIVDDKINLYFSGWPYLESEMNTLTTRDFMICTPIISFIIFLFTYLMLKNMLLNLLCMINLLITTFLAVGFFSLSGESVNMVTSMMPPVLFAIAVADSIHFLAHYKDEYMLHGNDHVGSVTQAVRAIWLPCLFTSLTTAVGFFSFVTASIRPVKILGFFTSTGVMIAFIMTITFLPAILILFKNRFKNINFSGIKNKNVSPSANDKESLLIKVLLKIGNFSTTSTKSIFIVTLCILTLTVFGILKIKFETHVVNFFPDDSKIKRDIDFVKENLGGIIPFETVIQAKSEEYDFTHVSSLQLIDKIKNDFINDHEEIVTAFSVADYFKEINKAFKSGTEKDYKIPESRTDILDYYEFGNSDDLDRMMTPDRMEARVSFQCHPVTTENARKTMDIQVDYLNRTLGENYSFKYTGQAPLWLAMEDHLKLSFIKSFLFAFTIIFFMMLYVCKDIKLTIISMVPNMFPIFLTIGIMGWIGIPFDTLTVMVACITLGISVDDTVHYIVWFKRNNLSGLDIKSSLLKTYTIVGKPIIITSIILFLGFFNLIMGSFKPMIRLGVLTSFAIFYALVADLVILPALIMIFKPSK